MEKHINFTPYNYVLNNQMILVDPDGRQSRKWNYALDPEIGGGLSPGGYKGSNVEVLKIDWGSVIRSAIFGESSHPVFYESKTIQGVMRPTVNESEYKTGTSKNSRVNSNSSEQVLPKLYKQLEKQLENNGSKSIFKSLRKFEKRLAKHEADIIGYEYKSSVAREINTFKNSIETIKQFINDKGLTE